MIFLQTDRQTDHAILPIDDHTACSTIGEKQLSKREDFVILYRP